MINNEKSIIALGVTISILLGFLTIFLVEIISENFSDFTNEDLFYSNISKTKKQVYLFGSSHVTSLNATIINSIISEKLYVVYNLGEHVDRPTKFLRILDKVISTNPEMIVYGISYREFDIPYKNSYPLPDPTEIFNEYVFFDTKISENPKLNSLTLIRNFINNVETIESKGYFDPFTPFFEYYDFKKLIKTEEQLLSESSPVITWNDPSIKIKNVNALNYVIKKLKQNNIKVVIFITPLHPFYLKDLSDYQKSEFQQIIEKIKIVHDVEIYDFTGKYDDYPIWSNTSHISTHKNALIFSEDIAEIIIEEINNAF